MFDRISIRSARLLALTATAWALAVGSAHAAPSDGTQDMGMMGMGMPGHSMLQQISKLHGQLNLNADQEKQWQAALDISQQNRAAARASREQMRQQFKALQQPAILDLNALHAVHQQAQQQAAQRREQTTGAWLALYNSLNEQQKTLVSTALKQHFARMETRHEKMRERMQHHQAQGSGAAAAAASAPVAQP
ncbi:Spy/CpxP family protein refolding chaperone [Paraburkholderia bonniea]|uniref:Spy/CpxP family protein refolding chaperone n=1 Tax=Paraburkholderia bonniea TaxID=2152891 RepID=UPI001FE3CC3B|nr:Spy/CpxP family protein refolding chaperone [Paraburkholderia bonniea]